MIPGQTRKRTSRRRNRAPAPGNSKPESSLAVPAAVLEINTDEVWWKGNSQYSHQPWTIVRQRLDAPGPGD
jgi:hypothetical protein